MELGDLNLLAVLTGAVIIFILGGLWYSPLLFAKPWMALQGKTVEEINAGAGAMPLKYALVFLCGLVSALVLAILIHVTRTAGAANGAHIGALAWFGFTAPSTLANAMFSFKPMKLWAIDTIYYLVAYVIVGAMLAVWQ